MCYYRIFKWFSCNHEEKRRKECQSLRLGACGGNVEFINIPGQCAQCLRLIYQVVELTDYDNPDWNGKRTFKDLQMGTRRPRFYDSVEDVYLAAGEVPNPYQDVQAAINARADANKAQSVQDRSFSKPSNSGLLNLSDSGTENTQAKRKRTARVPRQSHRTTNASSVGAEGSQVNRRRSIGQPQPGKPPGIPPPPVLDWSNYDFR